MRVGLPACLSACLPFDLRALASHLLGGMDIGLARRWQLQNVVVKHKGSLELHAVGSKSGPG